MMMDDIDMKIITHLWDGRTPFRKISKEVGVTTNTVRTRVNRLIKDGILQIIGLVDPFAIPGHSSAFVGFKLEAKKVQEATEQIRKLKGAVVVAGVSGRFNVIASFMFNDKYTYRDFLFQELVKVEGLITIETFFVVDAKNFNLRYVL